MNNRWLSIACTLLTGPLACNDSSPSDGDESSSDTGTTGDADSSGTDTGADTTGNPVGECGNDMIDGDEECDGTDLGGATCVDIDPGFVGGDLVCGASCTLDSSGCMLAPDVPLVALNELTSDSIIEGRGSGRGDAIELYNAGEVAADLSGWRLSDDPAFPAGKTYVFPNGVMLEPAAFLVLLSYDDKTMVGDYPFGINDSQNETIVLADGSGTLVDTVFVNGYDAVVSYCRVPDGTGAWAQCAQTFGGPNMLAETACGNGVIEDPEVCEEGDLAGATCESIGLGFSGGFLECSPHCQFDVDLCTTTSEIVLNELESTMDDIEIYNAGAEDIDIGGWVLTDDAVDATYDVVADTEALVFAAGTMIAAGEYLVVSAGTDVGQHPFGLGSSGDRVVLADLNGGTTVIDQVTYGDGDAMTSLCRLPNGPSGVWTVDCTPTMGTENLD